MIPITKPTIASFNHILEENELLFVIRHKDFYQYKSVDGENEIREIPNTYSRWKDRKLAQEFAEEQHGYKYEVTEKGLRTDAANKNPHTVYHKNSNQERPRFKKIVNVSFLFPEFSPRARTYCLAAG